MKTKQNISNQTNHPDQLPKVLEQLRKEVSGFKVPDGYFDSLNSRIVDGITNQENIAISKRVVLSFRKPWVWVPTLATVVVATLLIFVVPAKQDTAMPVSDEWTEINMAYDATYAEEALLAESHSIDQELENKDINYSASASLTGNNEPTKEEILKYLKEHEMESELLNEY